MGKLASATKAPRSTAKPPRSSTSMVNHAIKCGAGTPSACRIVANASGPLDSLAIPCCMKPYPTIRRSEMGAQRAIENRLEESHATSRHVITPLHLNSAALLTSAVASSRSSQFSFHRYGRGRQRRHIRQERAESLRHRQVRQNGVAKPRIGQLGQHGRLNRRHYLTGLGPDHREAEDTIVAC